MAAATDYLEAKVLDHVLGNTAFTQPTTLYVALFKSATGDDGTGTEVGSGVNYTREIVTFDPATAANDKTTSSNSAGNDIEFGPCTGTDWGPITHIAIYDSLDSSGSNNMLFHGQLSAPKTITIDDSLRIGAGNLTIELA